MPPPAYPDLIRRLPRTFASALSGQFARWDLLFPAEQRVVRAQLDTLAALPGERFNALFRPIVELEARMALPRSSTAGMSIEETGVLARSPLYPQWRTEVERVFSEVNRQVEASNAIPRLRRLLVVCLPGGLPRRDPLWTELAKSGAWVNLETPYSELVRRLASIQAESTWCIECDPVVASWAGDRAVAISWSGLARLRREFLNRLNTIKRDLRSADGTTDSLRRLDISVLLPRDIASAPLIREFVREILLSGNGSLVFNNSFVEWASAEALRRAQPQVLFAGFGIREKLKPFSSTVLFEDQNRSNPARDELDPAGSLIDAEMLAGYVYYAAQGLEAYQERTVCLLGQMDVARALVLAPKGASKPGPDPAAWALDWMRNG